MTFAFRVPMRARVGLIQCRKTWRYQAYLDLEDEEGCFTSYTFPVSELNRLQGVADAINDAVEETKIIEHAEVA